MVKQSPQEIRKEVLAEDAKKDIGIHLAIALGITAGISALGAICTIITARALVYFREGVDVHWLSCAPFLFPVVTGLFAAYKKQFALMGVHVCVTLMAVLLGGFGFGLSVEPLFVNRHICQPTHAEVSCDRVALSYLYLITGALAVGFAVIGLLLSLLALQCASKRIEQREQDAMTKHLEQQEQKMEEIRHKKIEEYEGRRRAFSVSSTSSNPQAMPLQQATQKEGGGGEAV